MTEEVVTVGFSFLLFFSLPLNQPIASNRLPVYVLDFFNIPELPEVNQENHDSSSVSLKTVWTALESVKYWKMVSG